MASPNPRQSSINLELALDVASEVDIFTNTHSNSSNPRSQEAAQEQHIATGLFFTAINLATDPFSDDQTETIASCAAHKLHPWVVKPNTDHPNYDRFNEDHTVLDEVKVGDESAYLTETARRHQT